MLPVDIRKDGLGLRIETFFPADARHLGIRNNLNHPREDNRLQRQMEDVIRTHTGPIYALAPPADRGDAELASLGMRVLAPTCSDIHTNLTKDNVQLCRVIRDQQTKTQ